jgi:hypothetical protein
MSITLTTPVTGAAQAGFTAPTYTITADNPPAVNAKQWAVTALGGTQAGVSTHSVSDPFTTSFWKPLNLKVLPAANPVTGIIKQFPKNTYKVITRKGALAVSNQPYQQNRITTSIDVVAGCDSLSPSEIRAMVSAHIGALNQVASALGDTVVTGLL